MFINYKSESEKPTFLYTHFLYHEKNKNHKVNISSFDPEIDDIMIQNCLDEMSSDKRNTHSVKVLCDFILRNPMETFFKFSIANIIDFFDYIKITETQKPVLQCICFFIQLLIYNLQYQELIQRLDFYSNIQKLIEPPTDKEVQELALWCAVYSLKLSMEIRQCLFQNEIYDTLMRFDEHYCQTASSYSEYIRGKFFKVATSSSSEMSDILLENIVRFLVNTIQKLGSQNQPNQRLFLAECIAALKNTFESSNFAFELIDSNHLQNIFVSLLFDEKEEKLRRNAANIIYELVQSMLFSNEQIFNLELLKKLFQTSKFDDPRLFSTCMKIIKEIFTNPESFDLEMILESLDEFNFSECFAECCNFQIKIEMLSIMQLLVFHCNDEQVPRIFTPENVEFFCDLISAGNCGVSADVVHIFTIATTILTDPEFFEMINGVIIDSGAFEQLLNQMDDPDNPQDDVNHINVFVKSLKPPEE